jgi:hypothetical protein
MEESRKVSHYQQRYVFDCLPALMNNTVYTESNNEIDLAPITEEEF